MKTVNNKTRNDNAAASQEAALKTGDVRRFKNGRLGVLVSGPHPAGVTTSGEFWRVMPVTEDNTVIDACADFKTGLDAGRPVTVHPTAAAPVAVMDIGEKVGELSPEIRRSINLHLQAFRAGEIRENEGVTPEIGGIYTTRKSFRVWNTSLGDEETIVVEKPLMVLVEHIHNRTDGDHLRCSPVLLKDDIPKEHRRDDDVIFSIPFICALRTREEEVVIPTWMQVGTVDPEMLVAKVHQLADYGALQDMLRDASEFIPEDDEELWKTFREKLQESGQYLQGLAMSKFFKAEHEYVTSLNHSYDKVRDLASLPTRTDRDVLQIGYNLGRLSELTSRGREVWDETKSMVESGNWPALVEWVDEHRPEE